MRIPTRNSSAITDVSTFFTLMAILQKFLFLSNRQDFVCIKFKYSGISSEGFLKFMKLELTFTSPPTRTDCGIDVHLLKPPLRSLYAPKLCKRAATGLPPLGFRQICGGLECPLAALSCVFTSTLKLLQNEADLYWNQCMREATGWNVQRCPILAGCDELPAYIDLLNVLISRRDIDISQVEIATNDFKNMYTCLPGPSSSFRNNSLSF